MASAPFASFAPDSGALVASPPPPSPALAAASCVWYAFLTIGSSSSPSSSASASLWLSTWCNTTFNARPSASILSRPTASGTKSACAKSCSHVPE